MYISIYQLILYITLSIIFGVLLSYKLIGTKHDIARDKNLDSLENENRQIKNNNLSLVNLSDSINIEEQFKNEIHSSDEWAEKYDECVKVSKDLVKSSKACVCEASWTVSGSKQLGAKMTKDNIKLALMIFNTIVDRACNYVRQSNYEKLRSIVIKQYTKINKLNESLKIHITDEYLNSKLSELELTCKYRISKDEERERIRQIKREALEQKREKERLEAEEKKLQAELDRQKEIEDAKIKAIEEQIKDKRDLLSKLDENSSEIQNLKSIIDTLQNQLNAERSNNLESEQALIEKIVDAQDKQETLQSGFVYVVSNYGAFGENVFKIGVTRRTDPLERVNELGNASVPFKFNIHAIIPSDEAFKLEHRIHKELRQYRVNLVNNHKEFFKLDIDELHNKLSGLVEDLTFDSSITEEQYLQTVDIRSNPDKFNEWLSKYSEANADDDIDKQIKKLGIIDISTIENNKNYTIIENYDKYFNMISEVLDGFSCKPVMRVTKYYMAVYLSLENNMKKLVTFYKSGDGKYINSFSIYGYEALETSGTRKSISIDKFDINKYSSILMDKANSIESDLIDISSIAIA